MYLFWSTVMEFSEKIVSTEETHFIATMRGKGPMNMEFTGYMTFCTTQKLLPNRGLEWTIEGPCEVLFQGNILVALGVIL